MKYRAEIDGLRALAVVPVILFHAGFELFSGGFVGVDVFFVISGYLITTILIEDIENKRFSIVNFYERRARRILPALFFVMLVCIPFAWMWMLPSQMKDFSQSLVAVSLFASNIFFWRESGYFDAAAEEKPLLHTWSLAVEEQYYVLFPIFLIVAWRFGKNRVFWVIVVMAAISLLLSEWGWRKKATANFYLAPTRAWELFAGSIAAFIVQKQGVQKNNLLAILGLAAIIFSIFSFDETTPFPSVYALVPVTGVVLLVLYADKATFTAKLLSTRGFVGIGIISYSAYLWHQPLLAFARIRLAEPSNYLMAVLALLSVGLAYLSWKFIEAPFREKQKINRKIIFFLSAFGIFLFATLGVIGHKTNGYEMRLTTQEKTLLESLSNDQTQFEVNVSKKSYFENDGRRKILIIGDSYAKDFLEGMLNVFGDDISRFDIIMWDVSRRCKNVAEDTKDLNSYLYPLDRHCFSYPRRIGNTALTKLVEEADLVVVRSYWDVLPTLQMPRTYDFLNNLNSGRIVFIGSQFFGTVNPFSSLILMRDIHPNMYLYDVSEVTPYSYRNDENYTSYQLVNLANELMENRNYFDVFSMFCTSERCLVTDEKGYPLTNDLAHLTSNGEKLMFSSLFHNHKFRDIWKRTLGFIPNHL